MNTKPTVLDSEVTQTVATFDADFAAGIAVQVVQQNILPVTAIANKSKVGQRSFWRADLLFHLA